MDYKTWLEYMANRTGNKNIARDEEDYDLQGYFNNLKANPGTPGVFDPKTVHPHLEDTFKKPNHPTFSDQSKFHVPVVQQGGSWDENTFTPSEHNLQNMPPEQMQNYFNKYESPETLNLQKQARISAMKKLGGE